MSFKNKGRSLTMKKLTVLITALVVALFIAGCATSGPTVNDKLNDAKSNAPAGALIGQGSAKEGSLDAAEKKAKDRAYFALVKGMNFIVKDIIDDAVTAGRLTTADADALKINVQNALSRSALNRAVKVDAGTIGKDEAWAVYYLTKEDALKEIDAAVAASNPPRGFNTNAFEAKYPAAANREWKN
jgi:hypothetical protein